MPEFHLTDNVGYLASILLMISFTLKNIWYLRLVNSLACLAFIVYGVMLTTAWPIIVSNGFVLSVNLFYLWRERRN